MTPVEILETFDGYPDGEKVRFQAGTKTEVAADYAALLIQKGLAKEPEATARKPGAAKKETSRGAE